MKNRATPDERRFKAVLFAAGVLVAAVLSLNIFGEYVLTEWGGYLKRRVYYERVIKKKGLTLHRGMHWRQQGERQ